MQTEASRRRVPTSWGITLDYYILRDRSPFHRRVAWRRAVGRLGGRLADYIGGEGVVGKGVGV